MKIMIRADSSTTIGSGHVMRCLTLARALRKQNATCSFVLRDLAGSLQKVIQHEGFSVYTLSSENSWEADAAESRSLLEQGGGADWVIVDHYALDRLWETRMRAAADHIFVIDDLADRPHDCDVLLDPHVDPSANPYKTLIPTEATVLFGPEYALLRDEFRHARASARRGDGHIRRILVSFGGADPQNATELILRAIEPLIGSLPVDVVIGAAYAHRQSLESLLTRNPSIVLHTDSNRMAELMRDADLGIGGAGMTTWERCAMGLPALVLVLAPNQAALAAESDRRGVAINLGDLNHIDPLAIRQALQSLLEAPERLRDMQQACWQWIPESSLNGAEHVAKILMGAASCRNS